MIDTVVIPAAGHGTRLLTVTKETPKEMMPFFQKTANVMIMEPLIERIFLQLFDAGIRNFFFIVGKNKRAIEDHFTIDKEYLRFLKNSNDIVFYSILNNFYKKIEQSNIVWINQNSPTGFGAAVLCAQTVVGDRPFLVHAGDSFIRGNSMHISKLIKTHEKLNPSITLYLREIFNPKTYGVAEAIEIKKNLYTVTKVEEKPKQPKSNFAMMPLYAFTSKIFDALKSTKPGYRNELQLTDGIQKVIKLGETVNAIKFNKADDCIDIGTPENYFKALTISYKDCIKV